MRDSGPVSEEEDPNNDAAHANRIAAGPDVTGYLGRRQRVQDGDRDTYRVDFTAGTRRIVALTGRAALEHVRSHEQALAETATLLRVPPADVPQRVAALSKELRELKKQLTSTPRAGGATAESLLAQASQQGNVRVVVAQSPGTDANAMRQLIDQLRKTASPVAVLLGSAAADKVTLVAGISRDLVEQGVNAGNWIKGAAEIVGGRGGGKPDMAQAGGRHAEKLDEALEAARRDIQTMLK